MHGVTIKIGHTLSGSLRYQLHAHKKCSLLTSCQVICFNLDSQVQSFQLWKFWDIHGPEFKDQDLLGEGVEFIRQTYNCPAHDTTFQKKGIYFRWRISSVQQSNAHKFHPQLVSHIFSYLLNYTELLDVSAMYPGHLQGFRIHKIVTTNSYIDNLYSDNHCIISTLYFIYSPNYLWQLAI